MSENKEAPKQVDVVRERVAFAKIAQEVLLISDELTNSSGLLIFKIDLANSGLTDSHGRFVGANFNTSALFSDLDIFIREFFYEDRLFTNVSANIDRFSVAGAST